MQNVSTYVLPVVRELSKTLGQARNYITCRRTNLPQGQNVGTYVLHSWEIRVTACCIVPCLAQCFTKFSYHRQNVGTYVLPLWEIV